MELHSVHGKGFLPLKLPYLTVCGVRGGFIRRFYFPADLVRLFDVTLVELIVLRYGLKAYTLQIGLYLERLRGEFLGHFCMF